MKNHETPQEAFWAGSFGDEYSSRNRSPALLAAKLGFFAQILSKTNGIHRVVEFGCNIGINLAALTSLLPDAELCGIEINASAAAMARQSLPKARIIERSILQWDPDGTWDLAFTCGVLIHLNPEMLPRVYETLARASRRYVLIAEYYNPTPVAVPYRGHGERLFKRDFAGEFLDTHPEFKILDYGFVWHRAPAFPLDDVTWFLMERRNPA
jgi:spore coat polysaccharide biosynthesis protein SpsF